MCVQGRMISADAHTRAAKTVEPVQKGLLIVNMGRRRVVKIESIGVEGVQEPASSYAMWGGGRKSYGRDMCLCSVCGRVQVATVRLVYPARSWGGSAGCLNVELGSVITI